MAKETGRHQVYIDPRKLLETLGVPVAADPMVQVLVDANKLGLEGKRVRRIVKYRSELEGFGERIVFEMTWEKED